mgnify:CR=1 FL=1
MNAVSSSPLVPGSTGASPPPGLRPLEKDDPTRIGPYRIAGRIGAGGMGAVYAGLDEHGRCVAVKTVHAGLAREHDYREAFAREVEMLARARGVSTARLHAADTSAPVPWLAFDYVPGRDLRRHVREFGPLEGEMLRAFAAGAAEGLAALHAAGIAHRDIKPGNVILSPDGPKIVDFGIATPIGAQRATDRSAAHGTPGWVSPERYTGVVAAAAADVFAWGGLVALAATGRDPFGRGTPQELRRRVCSGDHDVEGVPEPLRALVESALAVDPSHRPSAMELMRALLPPAEEHGSAVRGGPTPTAEPLRALLRDYWRGVDDAGHDPRRWAAAVGAVSAAGIAGGTLGGVGTGSGGAVAGSAGATAGTAGTAGVATGAVGGALGSGVGKAAVAGAGLLVTAAVATGGYVVYDRFDGASAEAVATAARTLEEADGFVVEIEHRYTETHAERVAAQSGRPVEEVLEESLTRVEYRYAADQDAFLLRGETLGRGAVAAAGMDGRLYVYGLPWEEATAPRPAVSDWAIEAEDLDPLLVTGPLRAMAESEKVEPDGSDDGSDGRSYTAPLVFRLVVDGEVVEESGRGTVALDAEGDPVRMEYGGEVWRVEADFIEVGGAVELTDPQQGEELGGEDLEVLHSPVCGEAEFFDRTWRVHADAWEMSCDRAMEITGLLQAEAPGDRVEPLLGYTGSGVLTRMVDGEIVCTADRESFGPGDHLWHMGGCVPGTLLGDSGYGWEEVEFHPSRLIRFVEVE